MKVSELLALQITNNEASTILSKALGREITKRTCSNARKDRGGSREAVSWDVEIDLSSETLASLTDQVAINEKRSSFKEQSNLYEFAKKELTNCLDKEFECGQRLLALRTQSVSGQELDASHSTTLAEYESVYISRMELTKRSKTKVLAFNAEGIDVRIPKMDRKVKNLRSRIFKEVDSAAQSNLEANVA